jgi:hypothetical protein
METQTKRLFMKHSPLLLVDAAINLALGIILLAFSPAVVRFFGLPATRQHFYPSILGAVLFGIGIALLIEYFRKKAFSAGLGLAGAVSINLCGGFVLAAWLLFGHLTLPLHGTIILWALVFVLIGLSSLEFFVHLRTKNKISGSARD